MDRADVIIFGGGLVGLALASALDTGGLTTIVVDPADPSMRRDSSFDFMMETIKDHGEPLAAKLRTIAKASPQSLAEILARSSAAGATQANLPPQPAPEAKPQEAPADA